MVQQMQGRVKPTAIVNGVELNDDAELEREAEEMGIAVININQQKQYHNNIIESPNKFIAILQFELMKDRLNVVGENHNESDERRELEKDVCKAYTSSPNYWNENEFDVNGDQGDDLELRLRHVVVLCKSWLEDVKRNIKNQEFVAVSTVNKSLRDYAFSNIWEYTRLLPQNLPNADVLSQNANELKNAIDNFFKKPPSTIQVFVVDEYGEQPAYVKLDENQYFQGIDTQIDALCRELGIMSTKAGSLSMQRSKHMHAFANAHFKMNGVWKIGEAHREAIATISFRRHRQYNLVSKDEFNKIISDYKSLPFFRRWFLN
ncbi:hypothetical protein AGMMS50229_10870 [Campylobacterota bacterium]|nr:hypothetical protein AGMMS50229_10870 [Campylobacterota bacterium]